MVILSLAYLTVLKVGISSLTGGGSISDIAKKTISEIGLENPATISTKIIDKFDHEGEVHESASDTDSIFSNGSDSRIELDKPFTSNQLSHLLQLRIIDGYAKNSTEIIFYKNNKTLYKRNILVADTCCN